MKPITKLYWLIIVVSLLSNCINKKDFPVLKGPYLGQKPPGMTPEIFAPGIISQKNRYELNSLFSPKGDEFYFELSTTTSAEKKQDKYFYLVLVSKIKNGIWTKPELTPFSGTYATMDICFSPDGDRLYFTSDRPNRYESITRNHIWYVDRIGNGWTEPQILGPPVFSPGKRQGQVSVAANGSMYFRTGDDLFFAKWKNGEFQIPIALGREINSPYAEGKPFVAPDESYLLFIRYDMPSRIDGGRGLYISFKNRDGGWRNAKNTGIVGSLPQITRDGKFFFFSKGGNIYWMDAQVIEELKPEELK